MTGLTDVLSVVERASQHRRPPPGGRPRPPRLLRDDRAGAAACLAVTMAAMALTPAGPSIGRLLVTLAFVLAAPGRAAIGYLDLPGRAARWTATLAVSLALCLLTAMTMLVAGQWHPATVMLAVQVLTAAALAGQLWPRATPRHALPSSQPVRTLTQQPTRDRSRLVAPVLLGLAALAWAGGLRHIDPATLTGWGLITALTPWILISYPLLAAAAVTEVCRPRRRTWLLGLVTAAAVLMVYGLQPAVEGVSRLQVGWLHAGFATYIAQHGHVLRNFDTRFSWPGFFALVAFLTQAAGGISPTVLLNWAPPVFLALSTLAVRALAGAVLGAGRAGWLATWVFLAADWTEQDYFSPQALGYVLMLAALAITVRYLVAPGIVDGGRLRRRDRPARPPYPARTRIAAQLIVLFLVVAIAPTHQLTPYALVGLLVVLAVWRRLRARWLPVLALVPPAVWFVLGAREFWMNYLDWITSSIGAVDSTVSQGVTSRVVGDLGHEIVVSSRIGLTCVIGLLAVAGWLVRRGQGHRTLALAALTICPFGLAVLQPYGGEVFMRCYLYALPWFALGAAMALDRLLGVVRLRRVARVAATAVLVGLIGTTVFVRGGNDAYVGVTSADVHAVDYVYAHAHDGDQVVALLWYEPLRFERVGVLPQGGLSDPEPNCERENMLPCLVTFHPQWVLVNPQQANAGRILNGWQQGWTAPIVAGLRADGYRTVFSQDSSIVLHREGA